jgi:DHA1 family bicyclomycin/chloramphenicol resistance-like MFS transporter
MARDSAPPPAPRAASLPGERETTVMMAMLMALNAMAIDTMLPALPEMARDLGISTANHRQFIIAIYLIGTAVGSLFYGPLADRFGRKPVLRWGLAAYVLLALGGALVTSFGLMLALRLGHGLAGAALGVVVTAIIRDLYVGDAMARRMSSIFLVFMVVPVIAPSIGAVVADLAGWRAIFLLMALLGLVMMAWIRRLPETLNPDDVRRLDVRTMASGWLAVTRHRRAAGYMVAAGLMQGALYGYLNSSEQIIGEVFGARDAFPIVFAVIAIGIAAANFSNSRIVERFGARRVSQSALLVFLAFALMQIAAEQSGRETLVVFTLLLTCNVGLIGFVGSNFGAIAMEDFGRMAGVASSYQSFARGLIAALVGAWIGQQYDGTTLPLALSFTGAAGAAILLVLWAERGRLFTRPGTAPRSPF